MRSESEIRERLEEYKELPTSVRLKETNQAKMSMLEWVLDDE